MLKVFFSFFLLLQFIPSLNAEPCSDLTGAWKFLSGDYRYEEGESTSLDEMSRSALKVLSDQYFVYIALEEDGSFHGSHGGQWRLEDGKYVERNDFVFVPSMKGREYAFECEVEGNRWFLEGRLEELGLEFKEVWLRVD